MIWFKRLGQLIAWLALFLGVATALFFTSAAVLSRAPLNQPYQPGPQADIPIFVLSNSVHTDLILPVYTPQLDWTTFIPPEQFEPITLDAESYIGFGWGEQRLYKEVPEWSDFTAEIAVSSMMWPTPSAMHVYYLAAPPPESSHVVRLLVNETQYQALIDHIQASFALDENGDIINLNCCWYPGFNDNFYESPQSYHFLRTCNVWTNNALKKAHLPTGRWALFDTDILRHLREKDER